MTSKKERELTNVHDDPAKPARSTSDRLTTDAVRSLAGMVGLELSEERISALMPQLESHMALIHAIDGLNATGAEPAVELHLSRMMESLNG